MVIDFHVHAFTDSIAERAVGRLCTVAQIKNYTDGTEKDTRRVLTESGVDYGVILPIATKPSQQHTINDWAKSVYSGNFICFGTVHPDAPDMLEELERVKALGLKGIKIHPDYQGCYIFSDNCIKMLKRCGELDLPVIIHMGYDPVSPLVHHALPQDLLYVREKAPDVKIIAAHLGGMYGWEAVYKYLCGEKNIWLDTAYTCGFVDEKLCADIIAKHGANRVLFGSDLPWHTPLMEKQMLENMPLSDSDKDKIFSLNAAELLELTF